MRSFRFILFFTCALGGCSEIFEKDISKKSVELIAPADSVRTMYTDQTFAWQETEGATAYRLVIVSPSFERAERYLLDTLVEIQRYHQILDPGEYEWRVRPENSAYEGVYSKRKLTVLSAPEINEEENENT